jgi:hypothetical protein
MTNPYDDYLAFERMMKPIRDYERMMQPIRDYERMMQMKLARLALLALSTLMIPQVLAAQSQRDTVMIQAGALRFVGAKVNAHWAIAIDTAADFSVTPSASVHTLRDAVAAASLSARIGQTAEFVNCENPRNYRTCTLNGVDAVVGLASVVFRADSATVRVRLTERQNDKVQIAEKVYVVLFVKNGSTWEYVGARLKSQT